MLAFKLLGDLIRAVNRDCESAEVIRQLPIADCRLPIRNRRNVICQAMIELARRLLHLLTQKIERRDLFGASVISVNDDIVPDRVCRPKCVNAARNQQVFRYDPLKQFLRVIEKFARLFADLRVIENRRMTPPQFPGMKERRPVDVPDKTIESDCRLLGSARVSRAGFGVPPKQTFLAASLLLGFRSDRKSSRSRDALASTRDACAPRSLALLR